jgi:hypothetical protein
MTFRLQKKLIFFVFPFSADSLACLFQILIQILNPLTQLNLDPKHFLQQIGWSTQRKAYTIVQGF